METPRQQYYPEKHKSIKQSFFLSQLWCFPRPYELFANHTCPFFCSSNPFRSHKPKLVEQNIYASVFPDSVTVFFWTTKLRSVLREFNRSYSTHLETSLAYYLNKRRHVNKRIRKILCKRTFFNNVGL